MKFDTTKHPVSWFREHYLDRSMTIKPRFQRNPVWRARQKCFFVESILMSLPVPEIYVQQSTTAEGKTSYAIVDGQQRIRTLLQFVGAETDPAEIEENGFALDKLPAGSQWANMTFKELQEDDRRKFFGYMLSVRYLETDSDEEIRDMFTRLNKYLTPLKPQELRNATYTGPFMTLATKLADDSYWAENGIMTAESIRRMGDIEFVSELLVGVLHGPQGGNEKTINDYYAQYEDYEDTFPDQRRTTDIFNEVLDIIRSILPDVKSCRWGNKTDFYTLFVALSTLIRTHSLTPENRSHLKDRLLTFGEEVDIKMHDETIKASDAAMRYVRAVEKGANEKSRRGERHVVMTEIISPFFIPAKKK